MRLSAILSGFGAAATLVPLQASALETCELALSRLITVLEERSDLSGVDNLYDLSLNGSEFSECRAEIRKDDLADLYSYRVYRHSDNVTILIQKTNRSRDVTQLYGPFHSAYRK